MKLFVTGDTHGSQDIDKLKPDNWPDGYTLSKEDILIVAGDFGLIWERQPDSREENLRRFYRDAPWTTCFIDGNHENHDRLKTFPNVRKFGSTVSDLGDGIYHLKRGEIYHFGGQKVLCIGGADSIDKDYRCPGRSWWSGELLTDLDRTSTLSNLKACDWQVDSVITHAAPAFLVKLMQHYKYKSHDPTTYFLEDIYHKLTFRHWYCGHYHLDVNIPVHRFRFLFQDIEEITPNSSLPE